MDPILVINENRNIIINWRKIVLIFIDINISSFNYCEIIFFRNEFKLRMWNIYIGLNYEISLRKNKSITKV